MIPEEYRPNENQIAVCPHCKQEHLKKNMVVLSYKKDRWDTFKVLCHICRDCWPEVLEELGGRER